MTAPPMCSLGPRIQSTRIRQGVPLRVPAKARRRGTRRAAVAESGQQTGKPADAARPNIPHSPDRPLSRGHEGSRVKRNLDAAGGGTADEVARDLGKHTEIANRPNGRLRASAK